MAPEKFIIAASAAAGTLFVMVLGFFLLRRMLVGDSKTLAAEKERIEREVRLEIREEQVRLRETAEEEQRELKREYDRRLTKLEERESALQNQRDLLQARSTDLDARQRQIDEREQLVAVREGSVEEELGRVAALDRETARNLYLARLDAEFRELGKRKARDIEQETAHVAQVKARQVVLDAMQRSLTEYITEATVAVVELPGEDMKGRIIGREGRNIRAFEQVTGVDLIIDDTPEAVVISSFDPVRRETARLTLMNLMTDGRIHPARIEELYERAHQEVERMVMEAGARAAEAAAVPGLNPRVLETLGKLRFRTSYAQNVLDHSVEVARIAQLLADELGFNAEIVRRAGLLHDIGKALGPEWEGPHALAGMNYLATQGEKDVVLNAVGAHHHEIEPASPEAHLVIVADVLSASRPGARRESLDSYLKRLSSLESLAQSFPGVERSYAVQAGREIRLIVKPEEIDDVAAARLANQVATKIESEMVYPGQIKVTVIRETRASQIAR